MPVLMMATLFLLLVLCLIFLWSGRTSAVQTKAAVLQWYQARKLEINSDPVVSAEGKQQLLAELDARVLEDIDSDQTTPLQRTAEVSLAWLKPLLIVVLFCAGIVLYWFLGAAKDVFIAEELAAIDSKTDVAAITGVIEQVESRILQTPDNAHYWALLARYYTSSGRHIDALAAYEELIRLGPNDSSALALAAQSEYLLEQRRLTPRAEQRARRALELEPMQVTALGLLGIAAFEQEQFQLAIEYWQHLLAGGDSQSASRSVIEQGIARARAQLEQQGAQQPEQRESLPAVVVEVSLAKGSVAEAGDTVFVLARLPGQRMPIAVKRYRVEDLPLELRLDDRDSMLEDSKLSAYGAVEIVAQVSPSGRPGQQYSTLQAMAGPVKATIEAPRLSLELAPLPLP